ncbi:putative helicase mov-10-B.1 [Leptopilina heterotoma]|uniref:putative helicase mov-10-B.1 n=1 Tax=Leptopilina heterotoma TaxID=63436 RepID=UPI001CA98B86|nr:putative helicase mov-10-B.1 [Leptopilina heterotoma]XP_043472686.1 putative helicase mov-10-B.1 [Leptopilina heterotoma]
MGSYGDRDELDPIPRYAVPEGLLEILKNILKGNNMIDSANEWATFLEVIKNLKDFDDDNYFSTLSNLLYLEECFDNNSIDDVKKKEKVKLYYTFKESYFKINLKNIEKELCFLKVDSFVEVQNVKMFPKGKAKNNKIEVDVEKHSFIVTEVSSQEGFIIVKAENYDKFRRQHEKSDAYYIEFEYSNWPIRVCQYAIDLIAGNLDSLQLYTRRMAFTPKTMITSFINKNVAKNPEQVQAVEQIVGDTSYPSPYLVFGPPGTGKTATIVEAVCQLIERGNNILICTPSNAAADEVTRRLLNCDISPDLIYRMTSKSVEREDIPEDVEVCINFKDGEIEYLHSYDMRHNKKVIISTLISAARFLRLTYFTHFFNYIFIDEAGQATQPETFIPFAISMRHTRCKIIMSGDPKQLGPVVMTKYGSHLLGISMLEHLMKKSYLYKKDYDNKYDPNFLTKLVQNYRSHETILRLPNQMYYDSELVACAGNEVKIAENWNHLPKKGFPIIFHAVYGHEENNESYSVANKVEAEIVMNYVEKLLDEGLEGVKIPEENIGIVTPFRYQKSIIMEKLENKELSKISVGTVESFQGQERDIIIVSLVRSSIFKNGKKLHVGFLNDDKRFNVTITRAKCLLIVIGHPRALQIADCWRNFITYCKDNNAYYTDKVVTKKVIESNNGKNPQLSKRDRGRKRDQNQDKSANNQNIRNRNRRGRTVENKKKTDNLYKENLSKEINYPANSTGNEIKSFELSMSEGNLSLDNHAEPVAAISTVAEAAQPEEPNEPPSGSSSNKLFMTFLRFFRSLER